VGRTLSNHPAYRGNSDYSTEEETIQHISRAERLLAAAYELIPQTKRIPDLHRGMDEDPFPLLRSVSHEAMEL
jgi:hypothetical protein